MGIRTDYPRSAIMVPSSVHARLKVLCVLKDVTLEKEAIAALEAWLDRKAHLELFLSMAKGGAGD